MWIVINSFPGCLPEAEPVECDTLKEALEGYAWDLSQTVAQTDGEGAAWAELEQTVRVDLAKAGELETWATGLTYHEPDGRVTCLSQEGGASGTGRA